MNAHDDETRRPGLTYVVATRNKLPFLKVTLPRLLQALGDDEEAILVDGASNDGTSGYLTSVAADNPRITVISEPDHGEAHALNKGLLRARGAFIKLVSDDDVFSFPAIRDCRQYMEAHPDVEVVVGNLASRVLEGPEDPHMRWDYEEEFRAWHRRARDCFFFNGLPMMVRRDALPLLGLFGTGFVPVDLEFSLRVTSLAELAWYTGVLAVHIGNPASNWQTMNARAVEESKRLWGYYTLRPIGELETRPPGPRRIVGRLRSTVRLRTRLRAVRHLRSSGKCSPAADNGLVSDRRLAERIPSDLSSAFEEVAVESEAMLAMWRRQLPAGFIRGRGGGESHRPKVAMIPDPFGLHGALCFSNPGPRLIGDALECTGYDVLSMPRRGEWPQLDWLRGSAPDLIHIQHPSGIYGFQAAANSGSLSSRTPRIRRQAAFDKWAACLESFGVPVVWQVDGACWHDVAVARSKSPDTEEHRRLFKLASALVFHEESCARLVFELFGQTKKYAVAPLGDFAAVFGLAREKRECRRRLGLPQEKKILFTAPLVGSGETLLPLTDALRAYGAGDVLIVAVAGGQAGHRQRRNTPWVREYGSVSHSVLRDLICAADFVVESHPCLTSGTLRTAMSYSTPVVAHRYGGAVDMCAGAAVFVEDAGSLELALAHALDLEEAEYDDMVEQAGARNRERSWQTAGAAISRLYEGILR